MVQHPRIRIMAIVENHDQLKKLHILRCNAVQGGFLGTSAPAEEICHLRTIGRARQRRLPTLGKMSHNPSGM